MPYKYTVTRDNWVPVVTPGTSNPRSRITCTVHDLVTLQITSPLNSRCSNQYFRFGFPDDWKYTPNRLGVDS